MKPRLRFSRGGVFCGGLPKSGSGPTNLNDRKDWQECASGKANTENMRKMSNDPSLPKHLAKMFALLIIGGLYWCIVVRVTGANEPWDAPQYWSIWYPLSLLISACAGPILRQGSWQAGLLLTFSQIPIMALTTGIGPLVVVGFLFLAALAIPAMALSQFTGWLWRRTFTKG